MHFSLLVTYFAKCWKMHQVCICLGFSFFSYLLLPLWKLPSSVDSWTLEVPCRGGDSVSTVCWGTWSTGTDVTRLNPTSPCFFLWGTCARTQRGGRVGWKAAHSGYGRTVLGLPLSFPHFKHPFKQKGRGYVFKLNLELWKVLQVPCEEPSTKYLPCDIPHVSPFFPPGLF